MTESVWRHEQSYAYQDAVSLVPALLSVKQPRKSKPHRAVHHWAAGEMGVALGECMLVAARGWAVAGAQWAGLRAAFIAREGQQMSPLTETPEVDATDLLGFAEKLFSASAPRQERSLRNGWHFIAPRMG